MRRLPFFGGILGLALVAMILIALGNREIRTAAWFALDPRSARDASLTLEVRGQQRIVLLGTIHSRHLDSTAFSLRHIGALIEHLDPDMVFVEARPQSIDQGHWGDGPIEMPYAALTAGHLGIPVRGIDWWELKKGKLRRTDATRDDHIYTNLLDQLPQSGTSLVLTGYSHRIELIDRLQADSFVTRPLDPSPATLFQTDDQPLVFPAGMAHVLQQQVDDARQLAVDQPDFADSFLALAEDRRRVLKTRVTGHEAPPPTADQAAATALSALRHFAHAQGWDALVVEPFADHIEVFDTQPALWQRVLELDQAPPDTPMPVSGLAAMLEQRVLLILSRDVYAALRPEYAVHPLFWEQLMAHEMAHRLHVRIIGGDEDAMGPRWFYEGFAIVASGQALGLELSYSSTQQAIDATRAPGRDAYARYAAAFRAYAGGRKLDALLKHPPSAPPEAPRADGPADAAPPTAAR